MIVVHGVDRFGRVDGIGDGYLVTRFHHVLAFPVVPLGSEWLTRMEEGVWMGTPCRLSWRSVLAGYARMWGTALAVLCALTGMYVPAVIAGALALASLWWRRMRNPRELRRVAMQWEVFGSAVDPARMTPAAAGELLRPAEERLAEVSGGRTALDVARDGATSAEQAARAFVVLRLAAGARRADGAEAIAASQRILERGLTDRASDGPYRAQLPLPPTAVAEAPPLFRPAALRPHRFHWFFATATLWIAGIWWACTQGPMGRCWCDSMVDIAKAGVNKLANYSYPLWLQNHPEAPCPTLEQLVEIGGSKKDPWGEEYRVRCTGDDVMVWSKGEDKRDGTGDDIDSWELE